MWPAAAVPLRCLDLKRRLQTIEASHHHHWWASVLWNFFVVCFVQLLLQLEHEMVYNFLFLSTSAIVCTF